MATRKFLTSESLLLSLFFLSLTFVCGEGKESGEMKRTNEESACGTSNLNATVGNLASLHSPNYPQRYPANSECWWTITAPIGYQVLINFNTFHLEKDYDFLYLYDAPSQAEAMQDYAHITEYFLLSALSSLPNSNYVTMKFTSDKSVQRTGFELTYQAFTCGTSNLNATVGNLASLHSPNYPQRYPANSECWWTITAPIGYQVMINFTKFDLEKDFDVLYLYDAPSQAEAMQDYAHITEYFLLSALSSLPNSNYVTMKFTSDKSVQRTGFELTYQAFTCGTSNLNATVGNLASLHSPNYPQRYPANSECWWTITAPIGYQVMINFTKFDLEKDFDVLYLYDAPSQAEATQDYAHITEYFLLSALSSLPNSNYVTMKFTSDKSVQRTGFELTYQAFKIPCPTLPVPSNGKRQPCLFGNRNIIHCRFSCNIGFKLSGSKQRACESNGSWTGINVTCDKIIACFELPVPEYGTKRCTDGNNFGSICNFTCNDGYILLDSRSRSCSDVDFKWSGYNTTCQTCGRSNLHATVGSSASLYSPNYPQNYPPNSECWWTITAPVGYQVQINFIKFDLEMNYDFLQLYDAPSQAEAIHEYVNITGNYPLAQISSTPNSSYVTLRFISDNSNERTGFELTYQAFMIPCPTLPIPSNGNKLCFLSNRNITKCTFSCHTGFKLSGSEERVCESNGRWTGIHVACDEITACSELLKPKNGTKRCTDGNNFGSICNFTCNDGYILLGSRSRSCSDVSFKWSGRDTTCQTCGPHNLNASVGSSASLYSPNYPQNYPPNSDCWWTITTPVGYQVQINIIKLDLEMNYDFLQLYDAPSQAEAIQEYANITGNYPLAQLSSTPNSSYVTLRFISDNSNERTGFELTYQAFRIQCPTLPIPSNGNKLCLLSIRNITKCTFSCLIGFKLSGNEERVCESNRSWTGIHVTCDEITACSELLKPKNGTKRCTNGNNFGSICNFTCNDGYELFGSESRSCSNVSFKWSGFESSCQTCGPNNLNATVGSSASLHSPNYPQNYPPNIECWWTITAPVGYQVLINFIKFDLEYEHDFLYLYDAPSQAEAVQSYAYITGIRSSSSISTQFIGYITMKFKSDNSEQRTGFELIYEAFTCGPSNINAPVGSSASLYSPNYPQNYPSSIECWWTITAPVGYQVLINFTNFVVDSLSKDLFELYDASSRAEATQPYDIIRTWDTIHEFIVLDSNYVTMKFNSDIINHIGIRIFELTYEAVTHLQSIYTKITCPTLPVPNNGDKNCFVRSGTIQCIFFCHTGFKLSGSGSRMCDPEGNWTGNNVTCDDMTACSELQIPKNGTKRCTNGSNVGSICKFTCNDGYELFGSESRSCSNVSFKWCGRDSTCQSSPPTPTCTVDRKYICDQYRDCPDNSDEKGCTCPSGTFTCACHDIGCPGKFQCKPQSWQCDGQNDCGDWSDEKGCACPEHMFKCSCHETGCSLMAGCVLHNMRCDGRNDCGDGSDEKNCQCSDTKFKCKDGDCIDRSKVNDGKNDCMNGDDEFICNVTQGHVKCGCVHDNDRCTSSGRCIPNSWIGDIIPDCENHDDEPCNASKVWCDECWVVINQCSKNETQNIFLQTPTTECHSVTIPSDQTQKTKTDWICTTSSCRKCLKILHCESGQIIDNENYCDTIPQCTDGSDEAIKQFGFRCSGKSRTNNCVLPQKNVYDSMAHCSDDSDLCFVNGEFRCFSCLDGKLIVSAKQVCDGIVDCYDMSDECLCANQSVCDSVLGEKKSRCPSNQMHCYNDTDCVDLDKVLCNSSVNCINGSNRKFCRGEQRLGGTIVCELFGTNTRRNPLRTIVNAAKCDGRPECTRMEDECQCEPRPSFCEGWCALEAVTEHKGNRVCDGYINDIGTSCSLELETNCPMRFNCKSKDKISIDKRSVCDGIFDCDDHSDENNIECTNKRFNCTKGNAFSIDKAFVCDGIKDCDNGEDETRHLCGKHRFYCESGQPISIDKSYVENGIKDCSEGSDECISLFSDRYEMIANPILRALFWIMGLLALIGNFFVCINTAKDVFSGNSNNLAKLANDTFILNLTISDFLMGVYLIAVVAQGVRYSGDYCFVDKEWRSSNLCSGLGTLALLSSETSPLIMAAMSSFRLVTVYRPFLSSSIKIKWIVITGFSCWILSTFIAIIPWFPFDSGYFISDVWIPNMFLKTDSVSKPDMFTLAKRVSGNNSGIKSWFKVKEIISNVFKYTLIKGEFGYYGETSVCMPRFYASTSEAAWQYSTFLISLNFALFLYMMIAYALVYKKASGMKQSRSTKKDPNKGMQKRISRLLLTDFCCWIPVCVMGYLSVAYVSLPPNAYIVSAGFLLPINSAMNPILYSKFIGRQASRAKKWIVQKFSCISSTPSDKAEVAKRCNTRAENIEMRVVEVKS